MSAAEREDKTMRDRVEIVEVSPRDGIQNEQTILSTSDKLELIRRAVAAGARRFEATSFVNPKRVPQMADADAVAAALPELLAAVPGVVAQGLALNPQGYARCVSAGLDEVNYAIVATDAFSLRNQGVTTADGIDALADVFAGRRAGPPIGITIAASFGCPFEGEVSLSRLMSVVERCGRLEPFEIALADTIGVAAPPMVTERVRAVRAMFPELPVRLHLHDTRNTGLANAWAGLDAGVSRLDASLGGIGGCPFAPNATGNIPTEDLVWMLERSGVDTGMDLAACIETSHWLEGVLGKPVPGMLGKAGGFPIRVPSM